MRLCLGSLIVSSCSSGVHPNGRWRGAAVRVTASPESKHVQRKRVQSTELQAFPQPGPRGGARDVTPRGTSKNCKSLGRQWYSDQGKREFKGKFINCVDCFRYHRKCKLKLDLRIVWVADLWEYGSIKVAESWCLPWGTVQWMARESTVRPLGIEHWLPNLERTEHIEIGWLLGQWNPVKPFSSLGFSVLTISEGNGIPSQKGSNCKCWDNVNSTYWMFTVCQVQMRRLRV